MQKIVASILLIAILGQSFSQGWFYLDYIVQKKEYLKRCVNKARPQMHCNGKCVLMKKLEEQEKREKGLPPELKLIAKAELFSSKSHFYNLSAPLFTNNAGTFFNYTIGFPVDRSFAFFHPPDSRV